ncbi:Pyoverdine/dityrosine biosynthesis protein-domain-containing protein [Xylaria arbuscula]|nr:Pyoverdine/dityrosine biosynthesis protein-domain-containing protein [Xylaria arbuscula]
MGWRMKKLIAEKAKAAAIVINRYRIEYKNDWNLPESVLHSQRQIEIALKRDIPVSLVIPAFPFKSSNRSKKVLGPLPDEAERLSLLHLDGLCKAITDVTGSDTFLTIVSDGITYNDILDVSDREVWRYGQRLRQMAEDNDCHCIRFSRIYDLVSSQHETKELDEELYLSRVSEYRNMLIANMPSSFDVLDAIANDPDISKTYKGYKKFLMSERDDRTNRSRSQMERENSAIAKAMIVRGKAFSETVKLKYPDSVRLSIHPSNDTNKVSITMLPQDNDTTMTPWHGAVVRGADGSVSMSHAILIPAMTHDIVYFEGRPSYFRERSDLFDWKDLKVEFEFLYPCGILITPASSSSNYNLHMLNMENVRKLAMFCSPIILRGFVDHLCRDSNTSIHHHTMSEPNIAKHETMSLDCSGPSAVQPQHSLLRLSAQSGSEHTLFSSSDLLMRYLPQAYPTSKLQKSRWKYRGTGNNQLIIRHPTRNSPCIHWHWPWQTSKASNEITIENGSQGLIPLINGLLADRRVCLRFQGRQGDVAVVDNFTMLHTVTTSPGINRISDL